MSKQFRALLSPLRLGKHILKSRMYAPQALPHYLQGPETYPADPLILHLANIARNGAAIVDCSVWGDTDQRKAWGTAGHFPSFDYTDPAVETYVCKMVDAIHFYGSLASIYMNPLELHNFQPLADQNIPFPFRFSTVSKVSEITREMMDQMIDEAVAKCKYFKNLGFDMVSFQMSYREFLHIGMSKYFSPLTNDRTDAYGGDVEGRTRLPLELCRAVKAACGQDFPICVWVAGEEEAGGITVEDTVAFAKLAEGVVDILNIRGGNVNPNHPTGFNSNPDEPETLHVARAVKRSGAKILVCAAGGYGDPIKNEQYIANGDLDLVGIGRQFICDEDYGIKIMEDRPEDIVPCQRCAKCHVPYIDGPWVCVCSSNPKMGLRDYMDTLVKPPVKKKKVAVVGGGIAGIEAALVCAQRGHAVTLFEKEDFLGGQLLHADYSAFKWPLRNFKNRMVDFLRKSTVDIRLHTEATPALLSEMCFDVVIAAIGSEPNMPDIPGAAGENVWTPLAVYGHEQELGHRVVVVGGGEIGTETGLYLAEAGHDITVLTRQTRLAPDATCTHYREMFEDRWEACPNFHHIEDAHTVEITPTGVVYREMLREAPPEGALKPGEVAVGQYIGDGAAHTIDCDAVVLAGGRRDRTDAALQFYGAAEEFYLIGDCREPGNVQQCMRAAFSTASRI